MNDLNTWPCGLNAQAMYFFVLGINTKPTKKLEYAHEMLLTEYMLINYKLLVENMMSCYLGCQQ